MALQSSGQITFTNIRNEFGESTNNKIGSYRVSQNIGDMTNIPLDNGIPSSGQIRFSDFYGKKLNVVVHYSTDENRPDEARLRYNSDTEVTVIGEFRDKPANNSGTDLNIEIGYEAVVSGAGGNGGAGAGEGRENHTDGGNGTSAIGLQYQVNSINVQDGGIVQGGGGGGAGGSGDIEGEEDTTGAGGGGGAGIPFGTAGRYGNGRENGSTFDGGNGGDGATEEGAIGGGGGGGGATYGTFGAAGRNRGASNGSATQGGDGGKAPGFTRREGGINGYSITTSNGITLPTITGNVYGSQSAGTGVQ